MGVERYVSQDMTCINKSGTWTIQIGDTSMNTRNAAYLSITNYKKLKEDYLGYVEQTRTPLSENDVTDFLKEAREASFMDLGGYVVFFIRKRGEYCLRHSKPVIEMS